MSAATAAVVWMFIEWARHGRPSVLGIITGAVDLDRLAAQVQLLACACV